VLQARIIPLFQAPRASIFPTGAAAGIVWGHVLSANQERRHGRIVQKDCMYFSLALDVTVTARLFLAKEKNLLI
jgi:hypothetical protein